MFMFKPDGVVKCRKRCFENAGDKLMREKRRIEESDQRVTN